MLKKEEWEMRCLRKMNMYTVRCIFRNIKKWLYTSTAIDIVYTSKLGYS